MGRPIRAIGFIVSPGKGLIWYSPLVVLGVVGVIVLWRRDRRLALTLAAVFCTGLASVAIVPHWTDETWGPRYLMPVAWLPLLATPFWATTGRRIKAVGAVAAVAVVVQLVAIIAPFDQVVKTTAGLTGVPLFSSAIRGSASPRRSGATRSRWIPQLSPLLTQSALIASKAATTVGLPPITLRYAPYEAPLVTLSKEFGLGRPDIWWVQPDAERDSIVIAGAATAGERWFACGLAMASDGTVPRRVISSADVEVVRNHQAPSC